MKYTRPIRSLLCGLGAALLLLTCLPASALAAEKSFTSMFPGYADGARDPKAAEAVLAGMGTLIGQKQTVNGVTLTLEGALWNKDKMLLSFAIDGASIPREVPSDIYLNRDVMQVTLAEDQREAYVRSEMEEREQLLAKPTSLLPKRRWMPGFRRPWVTEIPYFSICPLWSGAAGRTV